MSPNSNASVIIIGSGAAGIAAATKLLKNNFTDIKILEAENRIGGRIYTIPFGDANVDLGAEFCDGQEGNIVYSIVKELDLLKPSTKNNYFLLSNGEAIKKETGDKIYEFAKSLEPAEKVNKDCEALSSVAECLEIRSNNFIGSAKDSKEKEIFKLSPDWIKTYLSVIDSTFDLGDLRTETHFVKCKGEWAQNWDGLGYKTIFDVMAQKYPSAENQLPLDDKVFLSTEVSNISGWKNGEKVTVTTSDGNTYEADHVIFTPSLGVLKENYTTLFNPALSEEKVEAINNIGYGAVLKVIMQFPERWWKDDAFYPLIWTAEDKEILKEKKMEWLIDLWCIAPAPKNSKVLIVWYAGSHIPLIETLSDEQLLEGHKHLLNKFFAPHSTVKMPSTIIRSSWYSNPHFRGTYAYESVKGHSSGGSNFADKLAKPLSNGNNKPTLLFAGEATHSYFFKSVQAAIESGYREAERLINFYQNK